MNSQSDVPPTRRRCAAVVGLLLALTPCVVLAGPPASAASPQVRWSDKDVVAGKRVRAVVDPDSRPPGSTLVLQRRYPVDVWRDVDDTARRTEAGFVLDVPTRQYGTFTYRVIARGGAEVERSESEKVRVRPPYDPVGRPGQWARFEPPGRWDSCAGAITWKFHPRNAPRRGLAQVKAGVRRIEAATGLNLAYEGRTTRKPVAGGREDDGTEVVIGWRTRRDYAPFGSSGGMVGHGGYRGYTGYREPGGDPVVRAVEGGVVLNASLDDRVANGYGRGITWGEVIIHELGHVLGLTHVAAESQIMHTFTTRRNAKWGAGDLTGLRKVGDAQGCMRRASRTAEAVLRTFAAR